MIIILINVSSKQIVGNIMVLILVGLIGMVILLSIQVIKNIGRLNYQ
jgi:hypothetical protein